MLIEVGVLISEESEDRCSRYLLTLVTDRGWWMPGGIVSSGEPIKTAAERYCNEVCHF